MAVFAAPQRCLRGWSEWARPVLHPQQQPKAAAVLLSVPFIPTSPGALLPFLCAGTGLCLALHACGPGRVSVALSRGDWAVVVGNLLLSVAATAVFCWLVGDGLYEVTGVHDVPAWEWLVAALWVVSDEVRRPLQHTLFSHKSPGALAIFILLD